MLLDIQQTGQPRAYRLIGELDISNADALSQVLDRDLDGPGDITLDLSELAFIDSSGIRVLLRAMNGLNGKGKLLLLNPTEPVRHVFSLMGLEDGEAIQVVDGAGQADP